MVISQFSMLNYQRVTISCQQWWLLSLDRSVAKGRPTFCGFTMAMEMVLFWPPMNFHHAVIIHVTCRACERCGAWCGFMQYQPSWWVEGGGQGGQTKHNGLAFFRWHMLETGQGILGHSMSFTPDFFYGMFKKCISRILTTLRYLTLW